MFLWSCSLGGESWFLGNGSLLGLMKGPSGEGAGSGLGHLGDRRGGESWVEVSSPASAG